MRDDSMMRSASPLRPIKRTLRSFHDAPPQLPDVEFDGGASKFDEALAKDSRESGCTVYLVFYEGDGRYLAWREED